jgi:hypothetical protein
MMTYWPEPRPLRLREWFPGSMLELLRPNYRKELDRCAPFSMDEMAIALRMPATRVRSMLKSAGALEKVDGCLRANPRAASDERASVLGGWVAAAGQRRRPCSRSDARGCSQRSGLSRPL